MAAITDKRQRKETLEQFRTNKFMGLGFSVGEAERLAHAKDDDGHPVHETTVAKLLDKGCTKELAVAIFT